MSDKTYHFDVIVLGAGAAGLMTAAVAGQRGKRVAVLDHADAVGKKILISGGGRCNFTNLGIEPGCFLSNNPHFAKSALARYTQHDFLELVNSYNIDWHEKTLGQLFCDGSAKQIVKLLLDECSKAGVVVHLEKHVECLSHDGVQFVIETPGMTYQAESIIVATGGLSIPKLGASDLAYKIARQFKLKIVEPRPALVPFTLKKEESLFKELSGVATDVITRCDKTEFAEAALFTHKGLSGPAILQISSYWQHGKHINVDFLPVQKPGWLSDLKKNRPQIQLATALNQHLPQRLAETLASKLTNEREQKLIDLKDADLEAMEHNLSNWQFNPNGTEGFAKAEVTIGGVATNDLSSKTMEAKKVPGLYFIGECVDVTGWLGGYNFQWAWSSGWVAGQSV